MQPPSRQRMIEINRVQKDCVRVEGRREIRQGRGGERCHEFTRKTFRLIERHFRIDRLQGRFGLVKLGFPLTMVPGEAPKAGTVG